MCKASPAAVAVPSPAVWPKHVELWRCMGSPYALNHFKCGAISEDLFLLKVKLSYFDMGYPGTLLMSNHTSCGQTCILKDKDCNVATHFLNTNSCQCNCRDYVQCPPGRVRIV